VNVLAEDELLPLSGLQHLLFCERQCALIHVEGIWAENDLTAEGAVLHERPDRAGDESRPGVTIARGLRLRSLRLGLVGRADVVEFRTTLARPAAPYPVEYKRGRRKRWLHDEVQLCAQAIALEEMTGEDVDEGAIFYGASRRRLAVRFDGPLRDETMAAAERFHAMVRLRETPRVLSQPKCRRCSLRDYCQPGVTAEPGTASRYLRRLLKGEGP
jgi:CRISPR-associated exonuclease Cas4